MILNIKEPDTLEGIKIMRDILEYLDTKTNYSVLEETSYSKEKFERGDILVLLNE